MLMLAVLMTLVQSVAPLSGRFSSGAPRADGGDARGVTAALAAGPELRLGVGAVKITPPAGAPMAGYYYNRAAVGVHDDLWAKTMVLELGTARAALVACDITSLPGPVIEEARRLIQEGTGLAPASVMISATHCHTGPVVLTAGSRYNLTGEMKRIAERYVADLPAKIAESVRLAAASLRPVRVSAGHGRETSLAFNRRYFMKDGTVKFNPGKLNPDIVRPAGPVDPDVPVILFETPDAKPVANYVNFAMHLDTVGGTEYSADFPYTLARLLRDAAGGNLFTLFTIGCAGNVNHFDVGWADPQQGHGEAARIGTVLAAEVLNTMKHLEGVAAAPLRAKSEVVRLPLPEVRPEDVDWAKKTTPTMGNKPDWSRFLELVKAFKIIDVAARAGRPIDAEVQVVALGSDIAWVGVPGELFVEHGLAIKTASPFRFTVVVELANDSIGYVPNLRAYDQGAYEVVASRCAPGSGEMLVDAAVRLLVALHRAGS
jgi:neutral ceramidase